MKLALADWIVFWEIVENLRRYKLATKLENLMASFDSYLLELDKQLPSLSPGVNGVA